MNFELLLGQIFLMHDLGLEFGHVYFDLVDYTVPKFQINLYTYFHFKAQTIL